MSFCSLVYLGRQAVWPRKPVAATSGCAGMPAAQRSTGQRWKDMTEAAVTPASAHEMQNWENQKEDFG